MKTRIDILILISMGLVSIISIYLSTRYDLFGFNGTLFFIETGIMTGFAVIPVGGLLCMIDDKPKLTEVEQK